MAYYILKSFKFENSSFCLFDAIKDQAYPFFLDSSLNFYSLGRYSFLGCNPFYLMRTKNENPLKELRSILDRFKIKPLKAISPFLAGAVGYLAYDFGFNIERKLPRLSNDDLSIPDCFFAFYDTILSYDHFKKRLFVFSSGLPETRYRLAKKRAQLRCKQTIALLSALRPNKKRIVNKRETAFANALNSNFTRERYIKTVKKAKEYIRKGDIYQVNLSQRFVSPTSLSSYEIYKRLRSLSPSFFSGYLDCNDFQIISSSPERFINLNGGIITTRPMKGTRPRSEDKYQDRKLKRELLDSAKDKAELIMIVDLERNDLGKVCNYGSVKIDSLRELETYRTVFQTTATVRGILHKDKDRVDIIKSCFPGGSITGCPKIRAMEIIEELEPNRRALYTGSMGYFSFCGNMDINILIRTILKKHNRVYFHTGGGIVADSIPENEYEETLVKAKAMVGAISD